MRLNGHRLKVIGEIRRDEGKSRTRDVKVGSEARKEDIMINGVEGGRKIKKNKSRTFLLADSAYLSS